MKKFIPIALSLTLLFCITPRSSRASANHYDSSALDADRLKATQLTTEIPIVEALGPLAPVALSPFFGLTCLSGTSILSTKGIIPENRFLTDNRALNNPLVFIVFLLLTLATSVPRFTTVTKTFAQAADHLETYAGIISYAVVFLLAAQPTEQTDAAQNIVYTAGVISFSRQTLLIAAFAINIFVINSVKFFFELLVWVSPIPFVDAIFECANKTVVAALSLIYAFNPALAFAINLVIFLICLTIFKWTARRVTYLKTMILESFIISLKKKLFDKPITPHAKLEKRLKKYTTDITPILKVFPMKKIGKIKKKQLTLLCTDAENNLTILAPRLIKPPKTEQLQTKECTVEIEKEITTNKITFKDKNQKTIYTLKFSHAYNDQLNKITEQITPHESPHNGQ